MMKNKLWNEQEINFLLQNSHLTDKEIGIQLNRTLHAVRGKRVRYYSKLYANVRYKMNMNFFKTWSSEMAYVLGFIFADGYIRIRNSSYMVGIGIKDKVLLEKINRVMNSNYPIKIIKIPTGNLFYLGIYRKEIFQDLINLGITQRKSLTMQFPKIPKKFLFDFIRGYFDGDGNTGTTGNYLNIEFTCGSESFIRGLYEELENCNISSSIYKIKRKSTFYTLKVLAAGRDKFIELLYKDASIFLERKYNIIKTYYVMKEILPKCIDCNLNFSKTNNEKRCKICQSEANKERYRRYYKKNKLKKNAYSRDYYKNMRNER